MALTVHITGTTVNRNDPTDIQVVNRTFEGDNIFAILFKQKGKGIQAEGLVQGSFNASMIEAIMEQIEEVCDSKLYLRAQLLHVMKKTGALNSEAEE